MNFIQTEHKLYEKKNIINPVKARLEQTSNFKNRKIAIRKKTLKKQNKK